MAEGEAGLVKLGGAVLLLLLPVCVARQRPPHDMGRSIRLATPGFGATRVASPNSQVVGEFRHHEWPPRATSHTRLRARDQYTSSTLVGGKRRSRSKLAASHYAWGTNGACECKTDVKSTWVPSYMASNASCFMVTWSIFKNHLLEVGGLTQNRRETMALRTFTAIGLFYIIMCEDLHDRNSLK